MSVRRSSTIEKESLAPSVAASQYSQSLASFASSKSRLSKYNLLRKYFEEPRKNCQEIAPYLARLLESSNRDQKQWETIVTKILFRHKTTQSDQHVQHMRIGEIDKSDRVYFHGEVSKRIYNTFLDSQKFNLYGQQIYNKSSEFISKEEKKLMAQLGHDTNSSVDSISTSFQTKRSQTNIGFDDVYLAPVGLQQTVHRVSKSQGNEELYSYEGQWEGGAMHGQGVYSFKDGETYSGHFHRNHMHGRGIATYSCGSSYDGMWRDSMYEGRGKLILAEEASSYEGDFSLGRREGRGRVELACGLVYEGGYLNGKPHGRGVMSSKLTGFTYEGSFDRYGEAIKFWLSHFNSQIEEALQEAGCWLLLKASALYARGIIPMKV